MFFPEFNNFFLNERSYKDCLKHGFTFNNLSKKELKNCLIFSDKFLDNFKKLDIKIKESSIYYNIGPELHYGTLPYRSNEVRNKALVVRGPNEKKSKHVFGEGLIRIKFYLDNEYKTTLGYISFCVLNEDVLLGNIQTLDLPNNLLNKYSKKYFKWLPIMHVMFYSFVLILKNNNIKNIYCASKKTRKGWRGDKDSTCEDGNYWKGTDYDKLFGEELKGKYTNKDRWLFDLERNDYII